MKFRSFKINGFDNINIGDYSNVKIIINIFFVFLILITNIFRYRCDIVFKINIDFSKG